MKYIGLFVWENEQLGDFAAHSEATLGIHFESYHTHWKHNMDGTEAFGGGTWVFVEVEDKP